ncbi:MAG: HBL/NHE enterotoxin family protein [Lewinellaceae bacterium]|nr:HBL/NHE enterotoxin family protein [Lewinellaceae bacterium]
MGKIASLVPQNASGQKDVLANHVDVLTKIRAYAIAVEQTNLQTIINPPPDWFDTLNTNLGVAKKHAGNWTQTLEPAITSTIPQAVINIGSRFQTGTANILQILQDSKNNPTTEQISTIQAELNWIFKHIGDEKTSIDGVKSNFSTFQTDAGNDLTNLTTGNNSIQKALLDDQKVVTDLNSDIAIQKADIAKDNAAITAAGIAAGVGLFVGVSVVGLGAASTGPAAPFAIAIGAFIIVAAIAEAATVIAIYEKKLAEAQDKLNTDTAELANEQQQIASLTVMNTSVTTLVDKNKDMAQSLTDIADWFGIITTQVNTVISDLNDSKSDMSQSDWVDLSLDIQQAQKDWANFVTFATGMQTTVTTLQNKIVNIHKLSGADAA